MELTPIYQQCNKCKGEGIAPTQRGPEDPCEMCEGIGYIPVLYLDTSEFKKKDK